MISESHKRQETQMTNLTDVLDQFTVIRQKWKEKKKMEDTDPFLIILMDSRKMWLIHCTFALIKCTMSIMSGNPAGLESSQAAKKEKNNYVWQFQEWYHAWSCWPAIRVENLMNLVWPCRRTPTVPGGWIPHAPSVDAGRKCSWEGEQKERKKTTQQWKHSSNQQST